MEAGRKRLAEAKKQKKELSEKYDLKQFDGVFFAEGPWLDFSVMMKLQSRLQRRSKAWTQKIGKCIKPLKERSYFPSGPPSS